MLTIDQLKMAMDEVLEERRRKRQNYSLSDIDSEHGYKMVKKMRLEHDYIVLDEPIPAAETRIPSYTWLDDPEDADEQRTNYMAYLKTHFKVIVDEEELFWLDVIKEETVLSVVDPRLPFGMKGTTDVTLVDRTSIQFEKPLAGVCMVVQLKKQVEEHHRSQLAEKLVSATLKEL